MRSTVRSVFVLVSVVALALSVASPAEAATSPLTRSDPTGDTVRFQGQTPVNRPKADIVSIRVEHKTNKLILRVTTRQGTDPATSPLWASGTLSAADWAIETTGDSTEEFFVSLGNRLVPSVFALSGGPVSCPGAASRFTAPATYRVDVPKSCLGNPTRVRVKLSFVLGTDAPTAVSDVAPTATSTNFGFTPFVRPA